MYTPTDGRLAVQMVAIRESLLWAFFLHSGHHDEGDAVPSGVCRAMGSGAQGPVPGCEPTHVHAVMRPAAKREGTPHTERTAHHTVAVGPGHPPNRGLAWGRNIADHTNNSGPGWGGGSGVGTPWYAWAPQCARHCARPIADLDEGGITSPEGSLPVPLELGDAHNP